MINGLADLSTITNLKDITEKSFSFRQNNHYSKESKYKHLLSNYDKGFSNSNDFMFK